MSSKSFRLWWTSESVGRSNVLGVLFGEREQTVRAAKLTIERMKQTNTLSMTRRELRLFAKELESGRLGVKYSYHNFYTKLIRKLLEFGFMERGAVVWDAKRQKTVSAYQLKLQSIPDRPPSTGFFKQAWQVSKSWNDLIQGNVSHPTSDFRG